MRFFEFETSLTVDEIQHRFSSYYEWEQHSSWNIFKDYTSPRKGLHLYPRENGFTGYYETGERNRHYDLQRAKAWINVKIKEKNGKRIIQGYTYYCPILVFGLLIGLFDIIFDINKTAQTVNIIIKASISSAKIISNKPISRTNTKFGQ